MKTTHRKTTIAAVLIVALAASAAPLRFEEVPVPNANGNFAAVAAGDVDKDGYAEILSGRREKQQGLFLFSYDGSQWTRRSVAETGQYGGVALADVTGDGTLDVLAVRNAFEDRTKGLMIFRTKLSDGRPGFTALTSPFTEKACDDLAVGDVEGDGDIDIALATGGAGVKVLLNAGKAASFRTLSLETDTYEDTAVMLDDINADARLDMVVTNHPGKPPRIFLCSRSGTVSYSTRHTEALKITDTIGYKPAAADFDRDGRTDLAVGTQAGLRVFLGNGCTAAQSQWWKEIPLNRPGSGTMQVAAGDIDGDGDVDITTSSTSGILVFLNDGSGALVRSSIDGLPEKGEYSGCCVFDWEGDGDLDIACSSFQGLGLRFFENIR